tara:strand:+ start:1169 stop:1879 length:711 start_codon:yes stop_codon:yes gene_type:complete
LTIAQTPVTQSLDNDTVVNLVGRYFYNRYGESWHRDVSHDEYQGILTDACKPGWWIITEDHRMVWWTEEDASHARYLIRRRVLTNAMVQDNIHRDDDNNRVGLMKLPNSVKECIESWQDGFYRGYKNEIVVDGEAFNFLAMDWNFDSFSAEVFDLRMGHWECIPLNRYEPEFLDLNTIDNDEIVMEFHFTIPLDAKYTDVRLLDNHGRILGSISLPERTDEEDVVVKAAMKLQNQF